MSIRKLLFSLLVSVLLLNSVKSEEGETNLRVLCVPLGVPPCM